MDIRNIRHLHQSAGQALARGRDPKKSVLAYAGVTALLGLVVMAGDFLISKRLESAVGLSNLGLNSMLSTIQMLLPLAQTLLTLCLGLGYQSAMLRIARGQYADHTDLKEGLRRFGPLLRCAILQYLLFLAVGMCVIFPCVIVFMVSPWSGPFLELSLAFTEGSTMLNPAVLDEAMVMQLYEAATPLLILYMGVYFLATLPVQYHLRMTNYVLLDKGCGAIAAMTQSFRMMRKNCLNLFRVDLSLWWYHLAMGALSVISYGEVLLPLVGITLPFSDEVGYYLFYGIYLAGTFAVQYFLRNRMELTNIMAYEAIRPGEPKPGSVVLGNIFQM